MIERVLGWLSDILHVAQIDGKLTVRLPLYAFVILIFLLILMVIIIWSIKRRRDPHFNYRVEGDIVKLMPSLTGLTHADLIEGNSYRRLQNGAFFDALLDDLENARQTINFETYLWKKGKIADRIIDVMIRKSKEGVQVRLLVDASGGSGLGYKGKRRLERGGVKVEAYHPWRFGNLGRMNNRDHRKTVVVDGRIGYIGGHCITNSWLGNAENKKHFRDESIRIEGPIVNRIQGCFSENWIEECGELVGGEPFFPHLKPTGNVAMHLAYITAMGSTSALELLHFFVIHAAKKQILIQNPYFLPDPEILDALADAVKRGVDVRVMLPATSATDHPIVQHASHHHFGTLLKRGVRIFEYQKTLLHQKVMTVDHIWSCIGSTNFDDRSFELNDEVSMGILDEGFASELEAVFKEDLEHCKERKLDEWAGRGLFHKLTDGSVYLINEQL